MSSFIILRWRCHVSAKVDRNDPQSYNMKRYSEIWRIMATLDTAYPILINFRQVRLKRLRMPYEANEWHILRYKAFTGPVWPAVGNGGQLWSRISSLIELVKFMAELRDLGLVYQVIACTALWDEFGQISSKVAYNGWVFVTVSRYDRLGPHLPCITFFGNFRGFLSCLNILRSKRHVSVKVARNIP